MHLFLATFLRDPGRFLFLDPIWSEKLRASRAGVLLRATHQGAGHGDPSAPVDVQRLLAVAVRRSGVLVPRQRRRRRARRHPPLQEILAHRLRRVLNGLSQCKNAFGEATKGFERKMDIIFRLLFFLFHVVFIPHVCAVHAVQW
jgi:hypothetical protein